MIPKSGNHFLEKIMLRQECMVPKSGSHFLEKIMLKQESMIPNRRSAKRTGGPRQQMADDSFRTGSRSIGVPDHDLDPAGLQRDPADLGHPARGPEISSGCGPNCIL